MLPDTELYCKAAVVETARRWCRVRHAAPWSRTESPEINPHLHGRLTHGEGHRNVRRGADAPFSERCWENRTDTRK